MNCNFLKQEGVVAGFENNEAVIVINVCSGCHASGSCSMGQNRIIKAKNDINLKTGDRVLISIKESFGFKSVYYCYILPFLTIIASMIFSFYLFNNELIVAISSIVALILYYGFLYFFNKIKSNNPNFIIEIIEH